MIENQLMKYGVRMGDVRYVAHTHLHIDHAGKDELFPMKHHRHHQPARAGIFRVRADAPAISGADIKHLIDRLHTKHALRLEDLELTGMIELFPGCYLEAAAPIPRAR